MSNDLSKFISTRGAGGTLNAIKWVSDYFTNNPAQTPLQFNEKLDAGKAVSLYGGYLVSKGWVTADTAYEMRTILGVKYSALDDALLGSQEEFIDLFNAVEAEFNSTKTAERDLDHLIGRDTKKFAGRIKSNAFAITPGHYLDRETVIELEGVISHLQALVSKSAVKVSELV